MLEEFAKVIREQGELTRDALEAQGQETRSMVSAYLEALVTQTPIANPEHGGRVLELVQDVA